MCPDVLRVALPIAQPELFDYLPPEFEHADPSWIGCRVWVPLARRRLLGVVAGLGPGATDPTRLRRIDRRVDVQPLLQGEHWTSLVWLSRYYHAPLGEVLAMALPTRLRQGKDLPRGGEPAWQARPEPAHLRAGSAASRLHQWLREAGPLTAAALDLRQPGWRAAARSLLQRGLIEKTTAEPVLRPTEPCALLPAQQQAVEQILAALGRFQAFLLDGVTGSGKTEVYLEVLRHCLRRGEQALVLVPEIGLTPQSVQRFESRLGIRVALAHSGLADGARAATWARMAAGEPTVLLGTRSAVLSPLPRLGVIVVDEEHDPSYKQQDGVRYSARDLALYRGSQLGVPVVLGSATPALESLAQARRGRYSVLRLSQRASQVAAPAVKLIDLRRSRLEHGLSPQLLLALTTHLERGEQSLVFRNRRGYAPVLLCHDCGWSARCRRCERPLTVHRAGAELRCHHCGAQAPAPQACPDCGGLALQPQGVGTERLSTALAARFPQHPVIRIDRETTSHKDALAEHLQRLGDAPGILVGTQMLAKGHDLPNLGLVAVVGIDEGLFSADFRATERLAQLLIQVSGRAGRRQRQGEVLLQTHHPDHPLLETLLQGGYSAFAELALEERQAAGLPPFTHIAVLRAEAAESDAAEAFLTVSRERLATAPLLRCSGPWPAPMPLRAGRHRWQVLLSCPQRSPLHAQLDAVIPALYRLPEARRVRWSIDVDPVDLY